MVMSFNLVGSYGEVNTTNVFGREVFNVVRAVFMLLFHPAGVASPETFI